VTPAPFFSVIVPCYNQAHFLVACINSIRNQEFKDWELIVVNDGSTDDTQSVAEAFARKDTRIKVLRKNNGGLSSARNAGKGVVSGTYVQFLDADDYNMASCFKKIHLLLQKSESDLVLVGYCYRSESGDELFHRVHAKDIADPMTAVLQSNLGPCHSIFIKRELVDGIGDFDENLKSAEDWDYWIRAIKAGGKIQSISEPLVCYRYVQNSMSRDAFRMYEALKTVASRAPVKDLRVKINSDLNRDYEVNTSQVIRNQLFGCLGVSIMQGKVLESADLFMRENETYGFVWSPGDFSRMYSYLSFRYWSKPEELDYISTTIYPKYEDFFKRIGLSETDQRRALHSVFNPVVKIKNRRRFGRLLGAVVNRFIR